MQRNHIFIHILYHFLHILAFSTFLYWNLSCLYIKLLNDLCYSLKIEKYPTVFLL